MNYSAKYQAPSVKKAFEILKLITISEQGQRISDLSKSLGISKSTVHGIATVLEELGTIKRDLLTKRYKPGLTLLELGKAAYFQFDFKAFARPMLEALRDKTGESVFLGATNHDHVTILDTVDSKNNIKITAPIGAVIPLTAGATGKVLLASLTDVCARDVIHTKGLKRYTRHTITDPDQYLLEIKRVREIGCAWDDEEYIIGVRAVAALIQAGQAQPLALWVVGFKSNIRDDKMEMLAEAVKSTANILGRNTEEYPRP